MYTVKEVNSGWWLAMPYYNDGSARRLSWPRTSIKHERILWKYIEGARGTAKSLNRDAKDNGRDHYYVVVRTKS